MRIRCEACGGAFEARGMASHERACNRAAAERLEVGMAIRHRVTGWTGTLVGLHDDGYASIEVDGDTYAVSVNRLTPNDGRD